MEEEYGIELKLLTDKFKAAMSNVSRETKSWANELNDGTTIDLSDKFVRSKELELEIKNLKKELSTLAPDDSAFQEYALAIKEAEDELKSLKNELKGVTEETKKTSIKMESVFNPKNARKFLLSLFSIRTVWSLISRASNTAISENDKLNQSISLTNSLLGNILLPVVEKVVNVAQYGAIAIAKIIQMFTGYNAIAKATTNSLKKVSSASKDVNKNLAGFDTLTNLSSNTNLASGIKDGILALNDFQDKVKQVDEIFKKYEDEIKIVTELLGIAFGVGMVKKIAGVLGIAGTATGAGATGLLGVLNVVGLLAAAAIVIPIAIKGIDKVQQELGGLKEQLDEAVKSTQNINKETDITADKLEQMALSGKKNNEWLQKYYEWLVLTIDNNESENKALDSQKTILGLLTGQWQSATKQQSLNNEETKKMIGRISNLKEYLEKQNETLDVNSEKYKQNKDMISQLDKKLKELSGYKATATVEVKANTSPFKKKIKDIIAGPTILISSFFGKGVKESAERWLNSFDVGTNYVPNDQIAKVHKGEMIVPKKYNPMTSNISNNSDVVNKLDRLIDVVESKEFSAYLDSEKISKKTISYINNEKRIQGRSVLV